MRDRGGSSKIKEPVQRLERPGVRRVDVLILQVGVIVGLGMDEDRVLFLGYSELPHGPSVQEWPRDVEGQDHPSGIR